jgi:hypothetical protein
VPLRLQPGYRPDGWLGILVGSRLYFDFSTDDSAVTNFPKLVKELGNRGKVQVPVPSNKTVAVNTAGGGIGNVGSGNAGGGGTVVVGSGVAGNIGGGDGGDILDGK